MPPRKKGRKFRKKRCPPPDIPRQYCHYCNEELDTVFIKCKDCEDIILCLECFSCGAELGNHLRTHDYYVLNPLHSISICNDSNSKWKAEHEFKLLHYIKWRGYGNWKQISKDLGLLDGEPMFTPEEVKQHYEEVYIQGPLFQGLWDHAEKLDFNDHILDENDPCFSEVLPPPMRESCYEMYKKTLGYMPRREDYEIEYEDEAELSLIDEVGSCSSKDEIESGFREAALSKYNETLRRRIRLKKFSTEYHKVQQFLKEDEPKPKPSEPEPLSGNFNSFEDFKEKMMPFNRFFSEIQFENFYVSLKKEKELKSRIKELQRMRELGCKTFEEARQAGIQYNPITKKTPANSSSVLEPSAPKRIEEGRQLSSIELVPRVGFQTTQVVQKHMTLRDYLTANEKILCDRLDMLPGQYIQVKAFILIMEFRRLKGEEVFFPLCPGLTHYHYTKIITYMGMCGWINGPCLLQKLPEEEIYFIA